VVVNTFSVLSEDEKSIEQREQGPDQWYGSYERGYYNPKTDYSAETEGLIVVVGNHT